jgi:hypothetical protein
MRKITARCGYRCDLCLIYRENLKKDARNRVIFRDGLEKYYGDKQKLEDCYCDGCMTEDSQHPVLITADCKIRPCVIAKGIENCGECDNPCQLISRKFIERRKIEETYGGPIPEADYKLFIEPYECKQLSEKIGQKSKRK